MPLVPDQGSVEEFPAAGAYPPFHDRVHPWDSDAAAYNRDPGVGEDRVEQRRVFTVAVADEVVGGRAGVVEVHGEVAGGLGDPGRGGVRGGAEDPDATGGVFDHSEDVQACPGQGHGLKEVGGEDRVGLAAEEVGPGGRGPVGRGIDAGLTQDLPDGGWGDRDAEDEQFAVNASVAPAAVLSGQAQYEGADRGHGAGPSAPPGAGGGGVMAGDQGLVPAQDGLRAHE
jgi:hypothetical protein